MMRVLEDAYADSICVCSLEWRRDGTSRSNGKDMIRVTEIIEEDDSLPFSGHVPLFALKTRWYCTDCYAVHKDEWFNNFRKGLIRMEKNNISFVSLDNLI